MTMAMTMTMAITMMTMIIIISDGKQIRVRTSIMKRTRK